jgi:hypothetical protein
MLLFIIDRTIQVVMVDRCDNNVASWSFRFKISWNLRWFPASFHLQEYDGISVKRIQLLRNLRHQPDRFNVLVRQVPFCNEHNAYGCSVDHFFSKHHPNSYCSYQMIYDGKDIEDLLVRFEQLGISYTNALALFHSQSRQISCSMLLYMLCMIIKDIICLRMSRYSTCKKYITMETWYPLRFAWHLILDVKLW